MELKPCPFCGNEVSLREKETEGSLNKHMIYKIKCSKIYSNDFCIGASIDRWFTDKDECIEKWNSRAWYEMRILWGI